MNNVPTDNPVSWFILLCVVIYFGVYFVKQALKEIEERERENKDDEW